MASKGNGGGGAGNTDWSPQDDYQIYLNSEQTQNKNTNGYTQMGTEDSQMLSENRNTQLQSMADTGDWDEEYEVSFLRNALEGSPYMITDFTTGHGGKNTVTLHHIGTGEGDEFDVNVELSATRSLSWNTDSGLPDLKSILQSVDSNTPFRQTQSDLTLAWGTHDYEGYDGNGFRKRGSHYGLDVNALDGANQSEFNEVMNNLYNL